MLICLPNVSTFIILVAKLSNFVKLYKLMYKSHPYNNSLF